ncbi:MAG: sigma-54 interaction domain-containing protein [Thermodesulfobacteriota bacterium]
MFEVLDCSPLPQFAVGTNNRITYWNKACELMTGLKANEMIGTDRQWEPFYTRKRPLVADLILKNDVKQFLELYKEKNPGQSKIIPNAWEAYDSFTMCGRPLNLYFMAAPIMDDRGNIVGAVETLHDLSGQLLSWDPRYGAHPALQANHLKQAGLLANNFQLGHLIGKSQPMQEVYATIARAAGSNANVIIYGESGTGKELVAKTIHELSSRAQRNFVAVNCSAIPETLVESEFFGYKKGAFTGAAADREGYLDRADGGTLFLDEIGDISLGMQVKLLRVLEGNGFCPVGGRETHLPDLRIIGATSRDMEELVREGKIRKDFYYRIHVIPVHLPPLRHRKDDLALLTSHFVRNLSTGHQPVPELTDDLMRRLSAHHWPGNVRELQNVLHRYLTLGRLDFTQESHRGRPPMPPAAENAFLPTAGEAESEGRLHNALASFEREQIVETLNRTRWHRSRAASLLGISRKTLFRKMRQYGIN